MDSKEIVEIAMKAGKSSGYLVQNFNKFFTTDARKDLIERIEALSRTNMDVLQLEFIASSFMRGYQVGFQSGQTVMKNTATWNVNRI